MLSEIQPSKLTGRLLILYGSIPMMAALSPVYPVRNDEGEFLRLLIHEDLYDKIQPVYEWYQLISNSTSVSLSGVERLEEALEWFRELVISYEVYGVVLAISILNLVAIAASKAIDIGKYRKRGFGTGGFGEGPFGGGIQEIREGAEDEFHWPYD